MTICETLKRLLSGVERITKNMNKNRALSIDSGTKEIAPPLPRDPMAGAAKDRLTVDRFPVLVERLRREEGGWSDHPKDNGGRTMFGVTEANYHDWLKDKGLPQEPVARLKWARAKDFYRERYWDVIKGPQLPVGVDWAGCGMSAEIIELDVITKLDLDASEILSEIAKEDPKHVFLVVWPKDGGHPTFHASTSDTPVVLYQLERFKHFIFSEDCDDAEGGAA
jgi:hypothetical protein